MKIFRMAYLVLPLIIALSALAPFEGGALAQLSDSEQKAIRACVGPTGVGTGNIWKDGVCHRNYFANQKPEKWVWYSARASNGCIIMRSTSPGHVTVEKRQNRYFWDGPGCSKNKLLNGTGILRTEISESQKWSRFQQGRMENGAFVGEIAEWTSFNPKDRRPVQMIGGCRKQYVESGNCQPRLTNNKSKSDR